MFGKRILGAIPILAAAALIAAGCSNPSSSGGATPYSYGYAQGIAVDQAGNVHIAGRVGVSSSEIVPSYWRNGVQALLAMRSGDTWGKAYDVAVDGSMNVYVLGITGRSSADCYPVYWKNGVFQGAFGFPAGQVTFWIGAASVDAGGGFVAVGSYQLASTGVRIPCLWVNGQRTDLPLGSYASGAATGIAYSSEMGQVAATGWVSDGSVTLPSLWAPVSSAHSILSTGTNSYGNARGVDIQGSDGAVAGVTGSSSAKLPCFWDSSSALVMLSLGTGNAYGEAIDVAVDSSHVYVSGNVGPTSGSASWVPCYWVDGVKRSLDFGAGVPEESTAYNIATDGGGRVYVAGLLGTAATSSPCYWRDGFRVDLPMGSRR